MELPIKSDPVSPNISNMFDVGLKVEKNVEDTLQDASRIDKKLEKEVNNEKKENKDESAPFWKLQYSLATRWDIFIIILGSIGSLGQGVCFPIHEYLHGVALGYLTQNSPRDEIMTNISYMSLAFVYVGLVCFIMSGAMAFLWSYNGRVISRRIREEYFRIIMRQEQGWFDLNNPYEFATKVQTQTKTIENGLGIKVGTTLSALFQVTAGLITAFLVNWKLSLVVGSLFPFVVICAVYMNTIVRENAKINTESFQSAGAIAEEVLYSIKTVASFCNFKFEHERFNGKLEIAMKASLKRALKAGIVIGIFFASTFLCYTLGVWYASVIVLAKGKNMLSDKIMQGGDAVIIISIYVYGGYTLGDCVPNLKAIAEACSAAYDFFELMKRVPQVNEDKGEKPSKEVIEGRLAFHNVNFHYPSKEDKLILEGIDIEFEPRKSTAIIGASGSGKSTVVYLIQRLYETCGGVITLDNKNIADFDLKYLRSLIGYVPQEPLLLNTSIRDNIIYGRDDIAEEEIKEACDKANVTEFLERIEGGLDGLVGVKGSKMSGGQKQRIAIARAILTKPKILILDEATSALDTESEKEVQNALNNAAKGMTVIIIAHRLSTIINADKIIALKEGKVKEVGDHYSLMQINNGYYASMMKDQIVADLEVQTVQSESTPLYTKREKLSSQGSRVSLFLKDNVMTEERERILVNTHPSPREQEEVKAKVNLHGNDKTQLWSILLQKKMLVIMALVSSTIVGAGWPVYGVVQGSSVDSLSSPDPEIVKNESLDYALYFILVAFFCGLGTFMQNYSYEALGAHITKTLRERTFKKFLHMHMGYYDIKENSPGTLMTKLSTDTANINSIVFTIVGAFTQTIVTLTVGLIFGFIYDWKLTLINIGFMPLMIFTSACYFKMSEGDAVTQEEVDVFAGNILSESVGNTKSIFSYNMQDKIVKMYTDILRKADTKLAGKCFIKGLVFGGSQFVYFACYAALFYASASFIFNGTLTLGDMVRSIMAVVNGFYNLGLAQKYIGDIGKAKESLNDIMKILNQPSEIDPLTEDNRESPKEIAGKVEFRNVSFSYPTRPGAIIDELNFTILPGQSVAFVGHSGCGKSTIIQLIERFYDVEQGEILIDDINIKNYDLITLRSFISLVGQEPVLFKRNIVENIKYGKLSANKDEIIKSAKEAKISSKLDGMNVNVSGGEKQRIAIARAMIRDPKILLLDEATSALDRKIEEKVQKSLEHAMKGRTSLVIAHRLSTVVHCDVIFVMEGGKIVEQGSHSQLMDLHGRYYNLHNASS